MTDRNTYNGAGTEVKWPDTGPTEGLGNQYARHIKNLYDSSSLPLTGVGGTADVVTASVDPVLSAGFLDGMKFTITWLASNTGPVTLSINGGGAIPVLDSQGAALTASAIVSGLRSQLEYAGGNFYVLSPLVFGGAAALESFYWQYTASDTWTKPAGLDADRIVLVECWGAGGGGARSAGPGGGGGGAYVCGRFRAGDLASSIAVGIGAAGLGRTATTGNGTDGGNTTFGALLTAFGGRGGATDAGGGGGGEIGASPSVSAGGPIGGGPGATTTGAGRDASTLWGGAGGGYGATTGVPHAGGNAIYGGGGGGGSGAVVSQSFSASLFGGNGGSGGDASPLPTAGQAPSGGGGSGYLVDGADGGRGEVRVWIP